MGDQSIDVGITAGPPPHASACGTHWLLNISSASANAHSSNTVAIKPDA